MITVCVLKDLNGWIGDMVRIDIMGAFGVPEEKDDEEEWRSSMFERGLCGGNTYFEHKSLHR